MPDHPLKPGYEIILGSQSPRRQQLLQGLDLQFTVMVKPTDETFPPTMNPLEVPVFLAKQKAAAFTGELDAHPGLLVITADTIVTLDGKILNKPGDTAEATEMLRFLSGRKHTVVTGVCLKTKTKEIVFSAVTNVFFREITGEEIGYYLSRYQPYDKAGSYGVQEWIGYACIERIEGSYFNVMGLPVKELYDELKKF